MLGVYGVVEMDWLGRFKFCLAVGHLLTVAELYCHSLGLLDTNIVLSDLLSSFANQRKVYVHVPRRISSGDNAA